MIGHSISDVSSYGNIFDNQDEIVVSRTPLCRSHRGMDQDCFKHHLDDFADDGSELDALTQCLRGPPLQRLISPPLWSELLGMDWGNHQHDLPSCSPAVLSDLGLQDVSDAHMTHEHRWTADQLSIHEQSRTNQQQHQQMFIRQNSQQQLQQHSQMIQIVSSSIPPPPAAPAVQAASLSKRQLKVPHVGSSLSAGPVLSTLLRNAFARSSATSISAYQPPATHHLQDTTTASFVSDASMFGMPRSSSGTSQFTGAGIQHSYSQQQGTAGPFCGHQQQQMHDTVLSQVSSTHQQYTEMAQQDDCQDMWLRLLPTHTTNPNTHADQHPVHVSARDCPSHHLPTPSHHQMRHSSPPRHYIPHSHPAQKLPTPCSSPARFLQASHHASIGPGKGPGESLPTLDASQARCSNESTLAASLPRLRLGRSGTVDQHRSLSAWDGSMYPVQASVMACFHAGGMQAGAMQGSAQQVQTHSTAPAAVVQDARDEVLPTIDETSPPLTLAASSGKVMLAPQTPKTPSSKGTNKASLARGSPPARPTPRSARAGQGALSKPLVLSRASFTHTSPRSKASSGLLDSGFLAGSKQFPWPPAPTADGPPSRSTTPVLPLAVLDKPFQPCKAGSNGFDADISPPTTTLWEELVHIAQPLPAFNQLAGTGVPFTAAGHQSGFTSAADKAPPPRCASANSDGNSNGRDVRCCDEQNGCGDVPHTSTAVDPADGGWGLQQEWWNFSSRQEDSQRMRVLNSEAASNAFAGEIEHWARAAVPNIGPSPFMASQQHVPLSEHRRSVQDAPLRPLPSMPHDDVTINVVDSTISTPGGRILPALAAARPVRSSLGLEVGSSSSLDTPAVTAVRPSSARVSKRRFGNLASLHGVEQASASPNAAVQASASLPELICRAVATGPAPKRACRKSKLAGGVMSDAHGSPTAVQPCPVSTLELQASTNLM